MMSFEPAVRAAAPARIALSGVAGSGRTYTALAIASGLAARVAVIDTQGGAAARYAPAGPDDEDGLPHDVLRLDDCTPEALITALATAATARYPVVVIDSYSSVWSGPGGLIDLVAAETLRRKGDGKAAWDAVRPRERAVMAAVAAYPGHVILTLRSRTELLVEEGEDGTRTLRRVAGRVEQRDGVEHDMCIVGELDPSHTLTIHASRCPELDGAVIPMPGAELGRTIAAWAGAGMVSTPVGELVAEATGPELGAEAWERLRAEVAERRLGAVPLIHPATGRAVTLAHVLEERGRVITAQRRQAERDARRAAPPAGRPAPGAGAGEPSGRAAFDAARAEMARERAAADAAHAAAEGPQHHPEAAQAAV